MDPDCVWAHLRSETHKYPLVEQQKPLWMWDHGGPRAASPEDLKCFLNGPPLISPWPRSLSMIKQRDDGTQLMVHQSH